MNIIKIKVEGLTCAHCASKIENDTKKVFGENNVVLNLLTQQISITSNNNKNKIILDVSKIVNKYEPDVKVYEIINNTTNYEDEYLKNKNIKIRFTIGIFIFILAILLKKYNISNILYISSYIIFAYDIILISLKNIIKFDISNIFDENFLMSIATIGAILLGEFSEAVFVMLFYQIGEYFQSKALEKSRKSIKSLMDLRPEKINIEKNDKIISISPEEVNINDIVIIKAGERIGIDGTVIYGESRIDTSAITGESIPQSIKVNDKVISGSININGTIKIKVEKEFKNSTMFKILELVENASAKKSKTEQFITKFAKIYTPIVVFLALILAIFPAIITPEQDNYIWIMRALTFLVISCPCALVLSVPLGFFSGIGEASKNGILIKGSNYISALANTDTIILDKTGTITEGVFKVTNIFVDEKNSNEYELLSLAYTVESMSNHPIAISINEYCKNKNIEKLNCEKYNEISGKGIIAIYNNNEILVGNEKLMKENNVNYKKNNNNGSIIYIAKNKIFLGSINVSDIIKKDSFDAIKELKNIGIKNITMLTGDTEKNANFVATKLDIKNYYSELLPQDKVLKLEEILKNNKNKTAFVGDGINDAPVLARADIGIAMGGIGSDAAIEAADIVIMNDNISKISTGIKISKNTIKIVNINIIMALTIKIITLILGALGTVGMWAAVFADVGVTLLAVLNSMRKKL